MSSSRISTPADSNRTLSADAVAANTLAAETPQNQEVDEKKDPRQAKTEKKPTQEATGFQSLDDVEKQGGLAALLRSDLNKLIIGLGTGANVDAQHAVAGASTALIEETFAPLLEHLPSAPSKEKPGVAFAPEGFGAQFTPRASFSLQKVVLVTQSEAAHGSSTSATQAPAANDGSKLPSEARNHPDARVRWVRFHQELTDKMFKQLGTDRALPSQVLSPIAAAAAMARARESGVWGAPIKSTGSLSTMRANLQAAIEESGPAIGKDTDIEIPSPELVQMEKAASALKAFSDDKSAATTKSATAVQGIDFQNGDVESIAILVMMGGLKVENALTLDLLKNIQGMSNQKEQLRKLATKAKQDEAALNKDMQNEYNTLKAAGVLHSTITFDQYKSWRECAYAGLSESVNADLTVSYAMPTPQLTQPSPPDAKSIPDWLKTGTVGDAKKTDDDKQLGVAKGMPPQIMAQLRAMYRAINDGSSFDDFLTNVVGLTNVYDIDDIVANLQIAKTFLNDAKANPDSLLPTSAVDATSGVNEVTLKSLQDKFNSLAKFEVLAQFFPSMVDASFVDQKRQEFMKAMVDAKMNDATATKFNEWKKTATPPKNADGSSFTQEIIDFVKARSEKGKYEPTKAESKYLGSGDDSFIDASDQGGLRAASEVQFYVDAAGNVSTISVAHGYVGDAEDAWSSNNKWDVVSVWQGGNSPQDNELLGMIGQALGSKPRGGSKLQGGIALDHNEALLGKPAVPGWSETVPKRDASGMPVVGYDGYTVYEVVYHDPIPAQPGTPPAFPVCDNITAVATADTLQAETKKKQAEDAAKKIGTAAQNGLNAMNDLGDPNNENSDYRKWARKNGLDKEYEEKKSEAEKNAEQAAAAAKASAAIPVDAATGLALGNVGTLEMFSAKAQEIKDRLDTLNGMSELESVRMQAQMERRAKFLETLSNMLKGMASTAKTIRDNTGK